MVIVDILKLKRKLHLFIIFNPLLQAVANKIMVLKASEPKLDHTSC